MQQAFQGLHFYLVVKSTCSSNRYNYSNRLRGLDAILSEGGTSKLFCLSFEEGSTQKGMPASVAQLDAPSDWRPGGRGFNPRRGRQHSFVEIDHEIFSTVILSLPLIQEGQLSVSGERMCTVLVNRLED